MRVLLIGDFRPLQDEGMRKLSHWFKTAVEDGHVHRAVSTRLFGSLWALPSILRFRPDCLHYLTGPTLRSLLALRLYKSILPGPAFTVATGLRPFLGVAGRRLLFIYRPDYYLAQARRWCRVFAAAGTKTFDLPNAVDCTRNMPVSEQKKRALRGAYGLPEGRPIVLHVGHVRANRNLDCLLDAQRSGRYQVVVIGSPSQSEPGELRKRLEGGGCIVRTDFLPNVEEMYQAADAYVFTVKPVAPAEYPRRYQEVGVIDFPLSILEAMANGLPVVTTRHDAVDYFLGDVSGLRYFDGTGLDCLQQLDALHGQPVATRKAAERFDLIHVMTQLSAFYAEVGKRVGAT